ncbi:hypothetical protein CU044_7125 [Streptomyces sp. L-9-10]|nr:hypothetical protein CU044_7125 [Streptomyces sp. L-9-10]
MPDLADRHSVADPDASQRCLHFTRLRLCGDPVAARDVRRAHRARP